MTALRSPAGRGSALNADQRGFETRRRDAQPPTSRETAHA